VAKEPNGVDTDRTGMGTVAAAQNRTSTKAPCTDCTGMGTAAAARDRAKAPHTDHTDMGTAVATRNRAIAQRMEEQLAPVEKSPQEEYP